MNVFKNGFKNIYEIDVILDLVYLLYLDHFLQIMILLID